MANKTLSASLCREIDNVFGAVRTCLITCCLSFQVFSWERILFLKSACVNKVMQIQVQTGDTRRLLFVNPPWSVEDFFLKKTHILREIPKTRFMDFGAFYENDKGNM